ncbi:MAG TPA: DNA repair protein RecO [Cellvibrionaceae bacterium]
MMTFSRIELQPAYVVHTRAYRDTSMLVDFFTPDYGRITAIARGVRKPKSPKRSLLNPFLPLLISVQGKSSLKLLTHVEACTVRAWRLQGERLFSGLYVNELIVRLLPEWDAYHELNADYNVALETLDCEGSVEPVLRKFESALLQALGYGVDYSIDAETAEAIKPDGYYCLNPQLGFCVAHVDAGRLLFSGDDILAVAHGDFQREAICKVAKQINRTLLAPLLGGRPLQSRLLFKGLTASK